MTIKDVGDWVTVSGATIAAIAGTWNLVLQLRGKRDTFSVRLGGSSPSSDRETMLHVVSLTDHTIKLTDWGFVEADGRFTSFRMLWEAGGLDSSEITSQGENELEKFGSYFETGYVRNQPVYGAYAISITQSRPRIRFDRAFPLWRRFVIRLRLFFRPHYLSW